MSIRLKKQEEIAEMNSYFNITFGTGFQMKFENGWIISVQFGPHCYCEHHHEFFEKDTDLLPINTENGAPIWNSADAAVAIWHTKAKKDIHKLCATGVILKELGFGDYDLEKEYTSPDEVAKIIGYVQSLTPESYIDIYNKAIDEYLD